MVVAIRARPRVSSDPGAGAVLDVRARSASAGGTTSGPFDAVLGPDADARAVYDAVAEPIVSRALDGYNGCVLAFGATGSGKTHAMAGGADGGLVARAAAGVFAGVERGGSVVVSHVEIADNRLRDLLARKPLARVNGAPPSSEGKPTIRERGGGVYVAGATRERCASPAAVVAAFSRGCARRAVRATAKNAASSRSHAVLTLELGSGAKVHLVDLAGSERYDDAGGGGRETGAINGSLAALGNVVRALERGDAHVPYRDAALTRLLSDALGGGAFAATLCCVSLEPSDAGATASTLRFAGRLRNIRSRPAKAAPRDPRDAEISRLAAENADLRRALALAGGRTGAGVV